MTLVDDDDYDDDFDGGELDGQSLLELPSESSDRFDDVVTGDFTDDAFWLDDVSSAPKRPACNPPA